MAGTSIAQKWLYQYKMLHVIMWAAIVVFTFISYYNPTDSFSAQLMYTTVLVCVCAPGFYYSAYILVPKYLYKRKFAKYIISISVLVVISAVCGFIGTRTCEHLINGRQIWPLGEDDLPLLSVMIWDNLLAIAASTTIKIISGRFRLEHELHELEKEKISTELDFLRSQVNPHFLFNILNTIYFQIEKGNTDARASIEKLSEMLRYQLYECTGDRIDIHKELAYVQNYVGMQSLRMEKGSDIKLELSGQFSAFRIAPLLISPLIENAFKHISHNKDATKNKVHIVLAVNSGPEFTVYVANSYDKGANTQHLVNTGGLGLQNLKRRLELLYPEKHNLEIKQGEDLFETTLKIAYDH